MSLLFSSDIQLFGHPTQPENFHKCGTFFCNVEIGSHCGTELSLNIVLHIQYVGSLKRLVFFYIYSFQFLHEVCICIIFSGTICSGVEW